jgi:hypothetical protein
VGSLRLGRRAALDEAIEKWIEQWSFCQPTGFASAMMGADYGVFANGRWYLRKNLQEMVEWLTDRNKGEKK